jgi:cyclopropane fatty-acyl-phospholipid synthase-like methyltransferase
MPDWNDIFTEKGKVFEEPHPDMDRLNKIFKEKRFKRILDLGCGTGRHLIFFCKNGFDMYGIDASPKALEIAYQWLKDQNYKARLKLHRMESNFPYTNQFFDAIISIQVIHHNLMKDILFCIKEIERILKKNGMIFLTFPILGGGSKLDRWSLKEIEENTYIPQVGPEKDLPHHFFTLDEIKSIFKSFKILENYMDKTKHRAILAIKK